MGACVYRTNFFCSRSDDFGGLLLGGYLLIREYYLAKKPSWFKYDSLKNFWSDWGLFAQIVVFHRHRDLHLRSVRTISFDKYRTAFIYNISPFIAALFQHLWFGEVMTSKKWLSLLLGFGSLLPEFYQAGIASMVALSVPRLITLVAVISSAYGWIVLRALVKKGYSPIFINGFGMFIGGLIALGNFLAH